MSFTDVVSHQPEPVGIGTQIARVAELSRDSVDRARHELSTARIDWTAEYSDYQSGGWWTASLLNESGDPNDVVIRDCEPRPTRLLERLPQMQRLLDSVSLTIMWARLARLSPNSFLWEHRDYSDLKQVDRCRLHIPISTCDSSFIIIGGQRVHLAAGNIWRLTPTIPHGACNLYGPDRIHVIIDCYVDDDYNTKVASRPSLDFAATPLPNAMLPEIRQQLEAAHHLVELGYPAAAEVSLMRLFYHYALPEGGTYDLVAELYESLGMPEDVASWRTRKQRMLDLT